MSTDHGEQVTREPAAGAAKRSRQVWVPALWTLYGAAYVAVFISHGQAAEAAVTAVIVLAIGLGLGVELRLPQAREQRLLGWQQDERQRLIHLHAAASTGYLAAAAALVTGFVEFAIGRASVTWPMNVLGGLILAYGAAMAFWSRRV